MSGTTTEAITTTELPISKLAAYNLDKYQWLEQYLSENAHTIVLPNSANTTVTYKLKINTVSFIV